MNASPPPRLEDALVANLDIYFENLGAQKPHALYDMVVEAMERPLIRYALARCDSNLSKTAEMLGLSRNTLRKKMTQHRIEI
jgi:Fis family transcriptional regulator